MLSSRTLGKFFTIQSLCWEKVRAGRVLLRALRRIGILPVMQARPLFEAPLSLRSIVDDRQRSQHQLNQYSH